MSDQVLTKPNSEHRSARWWTLAMVGSAILLVLIFIMATRRSAPVEETVTLSQPPQHRATVGRPVSTGELPATGIRELESIGDRIAQAAVLLRDRQRGPALRAVAEAETATRQLRVTRPDLDAPILKPVETELAAIEREIQHGNSEGARTRLLQLGRTVDNFNQ